MTYKDKAETCLCCVTPKGPLRAYCSWEVKLMGIANLENQHDASRGGGCRTFNSLASSSHQYMRFFQRFCRFLRQAPSSLARGGGGGLGGGAISSWSHEADQADTVANRPQKRLRATGLMWAKFVFLCEHPELFVAVLREHSKAHERGRKL